jgi:hypothetical protein
MEINIFRKLVGQDSKLTFDGLRPSEDLVAVVLGRGLRIPLGDVRTHSYSRTKIALELALLTRSREAEAENFFSCSADV